MPAEAENMIEKDAQGRRLRPPPLFSGLGAT